MKVLIACDSFKDCMTSMEAGMAAREGVLRICPDAEITVCPVADGGEGTVEALCGSVNGVASTIHNQKETESTNEWTNAYGAIFRTIVVTGPLGDRIHAEYVIIDKGDYKLAVLEMAAAAGLMLVPKENRNPMHTTTYGVGEMIRDAIDQGCSSFIIGIGGSATNDGGIGMLQALGYRFVDAHGEDVAFGGDGLCKLQDIYFEDVMPSLRRCTFKIACDVDNPLLGETGCTYTFAKQKGATDDSISVMEIGMKRYADLVEHMAICDEGPVTSNFRRNYPGAGAAGGIGYAFLMFLNAQLRPGVDIIFDELCLEERIKKVDIILTGEGKTDSQTVHGKTPYGVAKLAKKHGKRVYLFSGCVTADAKRLEEEGVFDGIYAITPQDMPMEDAIRKDIAMRNMTETVAEKLIIKG